MVTTLWIDGSLVSHVFIIFGQTLYRSPFSIDFTSYVETLTIVMCFTSTHAIIRFYLHNKR